MRKFFHDLIFPHFHNNFRSKLLHHQSLIVSILILLLGSFILSGIRTNLPQVLGISTDITSEQLLLYTNQERQANGAGALSFNEKLSEAADAKASNMFLENYWAHDSPSGKTPWDFMKGAGYTYTYAGENLAKGFTNTQDLVKAWMTSQSHRENMLSKNYTDVGFAVREGKINGEETVLVVEFLGNTALAQNNVQGPSQAAGGSTLVLASQTEKPLIDASTFSKDFTLSVAFIFLFVLILDMVVIEKQKITRFVGHNLDHILFFSIIILIIFMIARGSIL